MNALSGTSPLRTVQFQHPYFQTNANGFFHLDPADHRPVYVVNLGDQNAIVSLPSIRQELLLGDNGEDTAMLDAVGEALKFVDEIHMGDTLPDEIVNGEASWEPESRHRKVADRRVVAAMVKWSEGWDGPISELDDLQKFTDEHVDQEKIAQALHRLHKTVDGEGQGLLRIQPVLKKLATELSYIEAQRETIVRIRRIGKILEHIRRIGGGQAGDSQEVVGVLRSFKPMIEMFNKELASVDDKVAEFLSAVSEHETLFEHMRQVRNELRYQLKAWDEYLPEWDTVNRKNVDAFDVASKIGDLYRFLAPQFAPIDEWVRIDQYKEGATADDGADSEESAEQRSPGAWCGSPATTKSCGRRSGEGLKNPHR